MRAIMKVEVNKAEVPNKQSSKAKGLVFLLKKTQGMRGYWKMLRVFEVKVVNKRRGKPKDGRIMKTVVDNGFESLRLLYYANISKIQIYLHALSYAVIYIL
jgi:hypothetical protein